MVFDRSEIEQFISDGYVILRRAFSRELAAECREFVWNHVISWEHCTTCGQAMVQIKKGFSGPPFDRIMNPRLGEALDQLVGPSRWKSPDSHGYWSLLFPGFPGPSGWHVDAGHGGRVGIVDGHTSEHHHALTTLFLFSDTANGDGGTPMIRGSHLRVASAVAEAQELTVPWTELETKFAAENLQSPAESVLAQVTGEAGDVALMHSLLIHGFGPNRGTHIRFACNPLFQLTEPLKLERSDGSYSAVEVALRKGFGSNG